MTAYLFETPEVVSVPVIGEDKEYPIHRVFCVGQNYAAHAAEMGSTADTEAPFYFTKQLHSVVMSGQEFPYPPGTENYHFEMELAFTINKPLFRCSALEAASAIYSYGCALDMTRRDLQTAAKDKKRPWDVAKDVENAAVIAAQTKASDYGAISNQRIWLSVNGEVRQDSDLSDMVHSCTDILCDLSKFYHLKSGDIILTGTPAGVGAVAVGDDIHGEIDGLEPVQLKIGPAD
ncbi:MAG: fumarylacetoacetate hydrolase family protein [Paracoccaceae bacterium]|nr:fumarylacetoacetate hydrolase family protein [Paracoccaceae bacterium]MDG2259005.1 fumarylacetoacetate hydrolase family protein [Paracoccaceae bacterium]